MDERIESFRYSLFYKHFELDVGKHRQIAQRTLTTTDNEFIHCRLQFISIVVQYKRVATHLNVFPYVMILFDPSNDTSSTEWWFEFVAPLIIGFFVYGGSYFMRVVFRLWPVIFEYEINSNW